MLGQKINQVKPSSSMGASSRTLFNCVRCQCQCGTHVYMALSSSLWNFAVIMVIGFNHRHRRTRRLSTTQQLISNQAWLLIQESNRGCHIIGDEYRER